MVRHTRRLVFFKILTVVGALLLAVLILEGLLRIGVVPNSHQLRLSTFGSEDASHRILILGDSFIENRSGVDIHDRIIKQLPLQEVEILNLGQSGTGPCDYLRALREHGPDFRPTTVLLFYYVGNDLADGSDCSDAEISAKLHVETDVGIDQLFISHFLEEQLIDWRDRHLDVVREETPGLDPEIQQKVMDLEINPHLLVAAQCCKDYYNNNLLVKPYWWERLKKTLGAISRVSRQLGAELLFVSFPHTLQVNDSQLDFFSRLGFDIDRRILTSDRIQQKLAEFLRARKIPYLSLLGAFRAEKNRELFLKMDPHLNPMGETHAAQRIARFVVKELSLDEALE